MGGCRDDGGVMGLVGRILRLRGQDERREREGWLWAVWTWVPACAGMTGRNAGTTERVQG